MLVQCVKCGLEHEVRQWNPDLRCACSFNEATLRLVVSDEMTPLGTRFAEDGGRTASMHQDARMVPALDSPGTLDLTHAKGARTESLLSSLDHLLPGLSNAEPESLFEKYVCLEGLGAGGMGEVVRAFDRTRKGAFNVLGKHPFSRIDPEGTKFVQLIDLLTYSRFQVLSSGFQALLKRFSRRYQPLSVSIRNAFGRSRG